MATTIATLARNPQFIPLVYNYCDMWCERCPVTSRCLLFAVERMRASPGGDEAVDESGEAVGPEIAFARAVIESSSPAHKPIARLDLALCDASIAPQEPAIGHPLEFLARHYRMQAAELLNALRRTEDSGFALASPLETAAWYHVIIPAKTYRALVSASQASHGVPELRQDALGSAKLVLIAIERSLEAWQAFSAKKDDGRIGGLIELLRALRTGVELKFPDARDFMRPGLDQPYAGA